jgi:hypothetical protein
MERETFAKSLQLLEKVENEANAEVSAATGSDRAVVPRGRP